MSDGRGDAKGKKLPEGLRAPNLRGRPRQARTGEWTQSCSHIIKNIFTKNTQLFWVFTSVPWKYLVVIIHCEHQVVLFSFKAASLVSQMEDSEGTVRQIGAFSEEIQNLTVRIYRSRSHHYIYFLLYCGCEVTTLCLSCVFPEHAERRRILQSGFEFPEPQCNRRGLQRMRPSAPETWSCCEWNSVPTQRPNNAPTFHFSVTFRDEPKVLVYFYFFSF